MFTQQATYLHKDFVGNMNFIASVTGAIGEELAAVQEKALELGRQKPYTPSQIAGAMANLSLSGLKTTETNELIGTVLNLASAGRTDIEFAGQTAAAVMRATERMPSEMENVADIMAKTQARTSATVRDLSISSRQILGLASAAGHSSEELFAIIGLLRNLGQIPSTIGVYMRQILSFMARSRIQKDLKKMGVDVTASRKSFLTLVRELERVGADADKIMEIFLGPSGSLLNLLMNIGSDKIQALVSELENSEGFAQQVAIRQESGIYGAYRRRDSARQGLMHAAMENGLEWFLTRMADAQFEMYSRLASSKAGSLALGSTSLVGSFAGNAVSYLAQFGLAVIGVRELVTKAHYLELRRSSRDCGFS